MNINEDVCSFGVSPNHPGFEKTGQSFVDLCGAVLSHCWRDLWGDCALECHSFTIDVVQQQPEKQSRIIMHKTKECRVPELREIRLPDLYVGLQLAFGGPAIATHT